MEITKPLSIKHLSIRLTVIDLRKSTEKDPVLSRVVNLLHGGWPENVSDVLSDCIYYYRR